MNVYVCDERKKRRRAEKKRRQNEWANERKMKIVVDAELCEVIVKVMVSTLLEMAHIYFYYYYIERFICCVYTLPSPWPWHRAALLLFSPFIHLLFIKTVYTLPRCHPKCFTVSILNAKKCTNMICFFTFFFTFISIIYLEFKSKIKQKYSCGNNHLFFFI